MSAGVSLPYPTQLSLGGPAFGSVSDIVSQLSLSLTEVPAALSNALRVVMPEGQVIRSHVEQIIMRALLQVCVCM